MSDPWDVYAATWDDGAPARYAAAAFRSLQPHVAALGRPLAGARVLDFGCGTGLLSERVAPLAAHVVGLDPSPGMIARLEAKGLPGVDPVCGVLDDARLATPAFTRPFDWVLASSVCAFLDDYPGTLRRLARLLRPGGVFVQWDWALNPADDDPFGLTPDAITAALEGAGLTPHAVGVGFEIAFEGQVMAPLMGVGLR